MAKLTDEIKTIISEIHPAYIATAGKDGKPNVSAKGSFRVLDDDHLVFADVKSPRTVANLKENPNVSAIVLDPASRKGARIWGTAEVLDSGELFDSVAEAMAARGMKPNNVVKITVEEAVAS
jgi:predicted pyridoxine 5'-phosphate oxidase superfamily flavin-nucleotide-binding protein